MRRTLAILVAIVVLAAAIVAVAPASLAGAALERATDGRVTLAETDGTIWRGRGTLANGRSLRLPLAWTIEPVPLLRGEVSVHLAPRPGAASPSGDIVLRNAAFALRTLDLAVPADLIASIAPRAGLRASGDVSVRSPSLDWTPASVAGSARIVWQDAGLAIGADAGTNLGIVTAILSGAGDRLTGPVSNEGGDFAVRGTVTISSRGAPEISLTLAPRGGDPSLVRTLSVAPSPDGNGWSVDYRVAPR